MSCRSMKSWSASCRSMGCHRTEIEIVKLPNKKSSMESVPGRIGDVGSDRAELWLRRRQERRNPLFCTIPEMRLRKSYDHLTIIILRSSYDNFTIIL
jgi:hypothetical protein